MVCSGTLILMGGGLDSSYLASNLAKSGQNGHVVGIHFDYGHPASCPERNAVSIMGEYLGIDVLYGHFDIPFIHNEYEVKGRNLLLTMAAIPFAIKHECSQIALGVHRGIQYYDTTKRFLKDAQNILDGYFGGAIRITAPLINLTKLEIFELSRKIIPFDLIYSCEKGTNPPCKICPSCKDRSLIDAHN